MALARITRNLISGCNVWRRSFPSANSHLVQDLNSVRRYYGSLVAAPDKISTKHFFEKSERVAHTIEELLQLNLGLSQDSRLSETVLHLINSRVQKADIKAVFKILPDGHHLYDPEKWQKTLAALQQAGFVSNQIATMIIRCHEIIFQRSYEDLQGTLLTLQALSFRTSQTYELCRANPNVLCVNGAQLEEHFNKVLEMFSKKEIFKMLPQNPLLFTKPFCDVLDLTHYVMYDMGLQKEKIVTTSLYQHDLKHVKLRHSLLEKSGMYEKPNKHGATSKIENPSLRLILDTDDKHFCNKVAFIPRTEYDAYYEMHKLILAEEENDSIYIEDA